MCLQGPAVSDEKGDSDANRNRGTASTRSFDGKGERIVTTEFFDGKVVCLGCEAVVSVYDLA